MMQCNKTGLTDKDWKTILDVLNVYDPNDIIHVYPEMGTPEFVQDVTDAFKKVLKHTQSEPYAKSFDTETKAQDRPAAVDHMSLAYQQWVHDS